MKETEQNVVFINERTATTTISKWAKNGMPDEKVREEGEGRRGEGKGRERKGEGEERERMGR